MNALLGKISVDLDYERQVLFERLDFGFLWSFFTDWLLSSMMRGLFWDANYGSGFSSLHYIFMIAISMSCLDNSHHEMGGG